MNGATHHEQDDSEFVEVDPTGRYGRVCSLSLSPFLFRMIWFSFMMFFSLFVAVQWNPRQRSFKDSVWFLQTHNCIDLWYPFVGFSKSLSLFASSSWLFFRPQYRFALNLSFFLSLVKWVSDRFVCFHTLVFWGCFGLWIDSDIEHLMSFKGLKLLGIRSSCMISCRALKILKGFTVKSISWKLWSTKTLWNFTPHGLTLLIGISTLSLKCSPLVHWDSKFSPLLHFRSCVVSSSVRFSLDLN